ncbi:MAG: AAA family ATPase [Spirochaetaceae bacterium]
MSEKTTLLESIKALESQRVILGDLVVDTAVGPLKKRLEKLDSEANSKVERKYATVLFADVVNFTAMSETMDAEEVNETINELWSYLDKIIIDHGGFVDKHIGDAIMALFGAKQSNENDPSQAIKAALGMQEIMLDLPINKRLKKPLKLRIGINTGSLILSNVGSNNEFTAMGDTVNVASRLEHSAPIGGVLISDETFVHIRNFYETEKQDLLNVKGKKEPVQTYKIINTKEREFYQTNRGLKGIEQKFVGREELLKELNNSLTMCQNNNILSFSLISGEAGAGKTRLMKEFSTRFVSKSNSQVLFCRTMEYEKNQPFSFIRNILRNLFEILESDSSGVATKKVEQGFISVLGEGGIEKSHFVGFLAGYDFSQSPYLEGIIDDPKQIHDIAIHYFILLIKSFSSAIIFLDDIHWFDEKSLWLLEYIIEQCKDRPLYILGCVRSSFLEKKTFLDSSKEYIKNIHLKNLNKVDSKKLIQNLLNKKEITEDLFSILYTKSQGNPFYLEELTGRLMELNIIVYSEGEVVVHLDKLANIDLPPTLHGLLQSKVESLTKNEIDILQKSSILGNNFWNKALLELSDKSIAQDFIDQSLISLDNKSILEKNISSSFLGANEYIFIQKLLKDVVYERVLIKDRKKYHLMAAKWLIDQCEGREYEYASIIARHLELSKDNSAIRWFIKAGEASFKVMALDEAYLNFIKADKLNIDLEDTNLQIIIAYNLGRIYQLKFEFKKSLSQFESMGHIAQEINNPSYEIEAFYYIVRLYSDMGEFQKILEMSTRIDTLVETSILPIDKMRVFISYAKAHFRLGDIDKSFVFCTKVIDLAIKNSDLKMESEACGLSGMCSNIQGHSDKAIEYLNRAIVIEDKLGNRERLMAVQGNMALTQYYMNKNNLQPVISTFLNIIKTAQDIGFKSSELASYSNLAEFYLEKGELKKAENSCEIVIKGVDQNLTFFIPDTYRILSITLLNQKRVGEAIIAIKKAKDLALKQGNIEYLALIWRVFAEIGIFLLDENLNNEFKEEYTIEKSFKLSLQEFKKISHPVEQFKTLIGWSRYERQYGDMEKANQLWNETKDICIEFKLEDRLIEMEKEKKRH